MSKNGGAVMAYKKTNADRSIFENLLKENNKKKQEFLNKVKELLTAHDFYNKTIEEKTDFLLTEKGLKTIIACAKENLQLVEIGNVFEISQRQFIDIRNAHPTIYDAFDLGYSNRDTTVIDAMYKLASGFFVTEEEEQLMYMGTREPNRRVIKKQKYIPPNVYAGQYIMNNRKQFEYKRDTDKNQVPESNMFKIELVFDGNEGNDE
jgi:hypothetical protein